MAHKTRNIAKQAHIKNEPMLCFNITSCDKDARYLCPSCSKAWYCTKECCEKHKEHHRLICEDNIKHNCSKYVIFEDAGYDHCLAFLRSGQDISTADRNMKRILHGVVLRRDDELYTTPECEKILPRTTLRIFTHVLPKISENEDSYIVLRRIGMCETIFDTLVKICGKSLLKQYGHAVFYSGKRHRLYVINVEEDELVMVEEVPKLHAFILEEKDGKVECKYY